MNRNGHTFRIKQLPSLPKRYIDITNIYQD